MPCSSPISEPAHDRSAQQPGLDRVQARIRSSQPVRRQRDRPLPLGQKDERNHGREPRPRSGRAPRSRLPHCRFPTAWTASAPFRPLGKRGATSTAVVCQQPPVVRSAQGGDRCGRGPRSRRDYRNRGEPVVRSPTEARARRPTSTSRGSTCASSGPCGRPPAHGRTAECEANQQPDALQKQQRGLRRQPRAVRLAHHPGDAVVRRARQDS